MKLKNAGRTHVRHSALDRLEQSTRLLGTSNEHQHFGRIHDRAYANGERLSRHFGSVVTEETWIRLNGVQGKGLYTRSWAQTRSWLVKAVKRKFLGLKFKQQII